MRRTTYPSPLIIFATVLAFLLVMPAWTFSAQKGKPLNEQEVLELLEGGVPSGRVSEIVDDRGIDFEFTSAIEQKVRNAGGADDAVAALKRASQRYAESVRPRTGGLVVKTTPGETQIYLNDELKGMTSPEGEIRMPGLKPGSYTLRVSLLGYRSEEKAVTIAAGEDETIYVTLLQKPPALTPKDNPVPTPDPASPSVGIPVPGLKTPTVQFYEGPHDSATEHSQRVYRYSFDRSAARSIYWELDLSFPPPGRRIEFQVDAIWYKSDGSQMTQQHVAAYVNADWRTSWHTQGYGWVEPGHWLPGSYRVDCFYNNERIASGTFQIN
ncbi:MAG: carboxypeptidase-like regulatory domain-containing protein [Acidobacteriota bacterium]|nr:carboxypeptidase-like regulatory domain-containing protein [Acidobacteriota bacterium]